MKQQINRNKCEEVDWKTVQILLLNLADIKFIFTFALTGLQRQKSLKIHQTVKTTTLKIAL